MSRVVHHLFLLLICVSVLLGKKSSKIRINQVGYELTGPKYAVYQGSEDELSTCNSFTLLNESDEVVYTGAIVDTTQTVQGWQGLVMKGYGEQFTKLNFSDFQESGTYRIRCNNEYSFPFVIDTNMLFKNIFPTQLECYKKMRYYGEEDRKLIVQGSTDTVDIFGGYKEASGDASKHLSHLQYSNYLGGQENPLLTWVLLRTLEQNGETIEALNLKEQLLEEVAFGADYLMRSQHDDGWFYTTVFNFWDESRERTVCAYKAALSVADSFTNIDIIEVSDDYRSSFRAGGGIAIAALAKAARAMLSSPEFSADHYREAAIKGYAYIKKNNAKLCYDRTPNIIDDYCALIAAIELYKTTNDEHYLQDAAMWVERLIAKQQPEGWFASDDDGLRPFYHPAEEGLPLIALIYYLEIDASKNESIREVIAKSINWYLHISREQNPFNAVKLFAAPIVNSVAEEPRVSYFIPKRNETGYWYQGENARLASMTTAILSAAQLLQSDYTLGSDTLTTLAIDQLNWILGKNPYEVCMLYGFGTINNPDYLPGREGRSSRNSIKGGICNGISTSTRPEDWKEVEYIEWSPHEGKSWLDWRWIEQWLPHEFWFTFATSTLSHTICQGDTPITTQHPLLTKRTNSVQINTHKSGTLQLTFATASRRSVRIITTRGAELYKTVVTPESSHHNIPITTLAAGVHILLIDTPGESVLSQKLLIP